MKETGFKLVDLESMMVLACDFAETTSAVLGRSLTNDEAAPFRWVIAALETGEVLDQLRQQPPRMLAYHFELQRAFMEAVESEDSVAAPLNRLGLFAARHTRKRRPDDNGPQRIAVLLRSAGRILARHAKAGKAAPTAAQKEYQLLATHFRGRLKKRK